MTWFRQVLHVLRRDLRRTWMTLALYVVVLGVAVARAVEWPPVMQDSLAAVGWLVVVCAVLATAHAVLADDTIRADAFWAIQPLHASAVAASKLLYVLLLLVVYAGAMLVLYSAWQLDPLTGDSALRVYPALALTLLGMALVSSVFRTMASVGALVVGVLGLAIFARYVLDVQPQPMDSPFWWLVVTALSLACVAFVMRRYQARETTVLRRGAALGTGVVAMLFPVFGMHASSGHAAIAYDPARSLDSIALTLPVTTAPSCAGGRLEVPISVGAPPGWRVGLIRPTLDVTRDDGSTFSLSAANWMQLAGGQGPLLPTDWNRERIRVMGTDPDVPDLRTAIAFPVSATDSSRACGHLARVGLRLWVTTGTGIEIMRVPLGRTTSLSAPGYRARIISHAIGESGVAIKVRVSGLTADGARAADLNQLSFALLNPERGEVVQLTPARERDLTTVSDLPGGARHWSVTLDLALYEAVRRRDGGLESWRDRAQLLITRANEEGRGWKRSPTVPVP